MAIAIFLLLMLSAITATAQLELSSGDKIYLPNNNEIIGNSTWVVCKLPLEYGTDQEPIQIKNLNDNFIVFNWKIDKKRSSREVDFYKNDVYLTSCLSDSWLSSPLSYRINRSDNLSLRLGSSNLKGGWVEIRFLLEDNVQVTGNPVIPNPRLQSERNEGYNSTPIKFYLSLEHPYKNRIRYLLDWGDGNTSSSGFNYFNNNTEWIAYSWSQSRIYEVKAKAIDEFGGESEWSQPQIIKVDWLIRVPPNAKLQHVIDKLSSNTTVLLEGSDYDGPIEIMNIDHINISSDILKSNIIYNNDDNNYAIGLVKANNITIKGLNISGNKGVGLKDCTYCTLIDNNISFKNHGIDIVGGHNNNIERNNVEGCRINSTNNDCVGVSLEDTLNGIVVCNNISGMDISKSDYYMRNSTLALFRIVVPPNPNKIIVQYNPSTEQDSSGKVCCGSYRDMKWVWESCIYNSDNIERSVCATDLIVEKCK